MMDRRQFLLARGRAADTVELSCERLYMRYLDARASGKEAELFAWVEDQLRDAAELRLRDTEWLEEADLKRGLVQALTGFRARGGRVHW
ncbi:MAG TPA: hypothetical protein VGL15_05545 [Vicinamibacteria bacterium]